MTVAPDAFATIPTPPEQFAKSTNSGYRFVIQGCPADPETKPRAKVRISREFRRNSDPTAPPIHTLATATDRISVGLLFRARTALAAIVPCLCRRWTAAA